MKLIKLILVLICIISLSNIVKSQPTVNWLENFTGVPDRTIYNFNGWRCTTNNSANIVHAQYWQFYQTTAVGQYGTCEHNASADGSTNSVNLNVSNFNFTSKKINHTNYLLYSICSATNQSTKYCGWANDGGTGTDQYYVMFDNVGQHYALNKIVGGVDTQLKAATTSIVLRNNDNITLGVFRNGTTNTVAVWINETLKLSVTDNSITTIKAVGLDAWSGGTGYKAHYDDLKVTVYTPPDLVPAQITKINCTSCNPPHGDTTEPFETYGRTPTVSFNISENSNCRIADSNISYSEMGLSGSSRQCSVTGSMQQVCTLTSQDALYSGTAYAYVACIDGGSNEVREDMQFTVKIDSVNQTSQSSGFRIFSSALQTVVFFIDRLTGIVSTYSDLVVGRDLNVTGGISVAESLRVYSQAGAGNAFACFNSEGNLYRSSTACS